MTFVLKGNQSGVIPDAKNHYKEMQKELNAKGMIVLIGETLDIPYEEQIENIVKCLQAAAPIVEKENVTLVVEPLNDIDRKNYFLPRAKEVFEILRKVNSPNIKI